MTTNNYPVVKVEIDEAKELAEHAAVVQDLGAVMETCRRIEELIQQDSQDRVLIEGLWTAALVRYCRCFAKAKRKGIDETIFNGMKGEPLEAHKYYIDMRNKHIAHSVNPFEQAYAGVVLTPEESGKKEVVGTCSFVMRHIVCDLNGVHQLGVLAKVVLGVICDRAKKCEQNLLKKSKEIPIDALYQNERLQITAPGPDKAGRVRK